MAARVGSDGVHDQADLRARRAARLSTGRVDRLRSSGGGGADPRDLRPHDAVALHAAGRRSGVRPRGCGRRVQHLGEGDAWAQLECGGHLQARPRADRGRALCPGASSDLHGDHRDGSGDRRRLRASDRLRARALDVWRALVEGTPGGGDHGTALSRGVRGLCGAGPGDHPLRALVKEPDDGVRRPTAGKGPQAPNPFACNRRERSQP